MNEERIKISINEEDVQNIIDCYEKDIKYIEALEKENQQLKHILDELEGWLDRYENTTKLFNVFELLNKIKELRGRE